MAFDMGNGLAAAGYGAGDLFAKGALMDAENEARTKLVNAQNEAEYERMRRLEEFKQSMKTARQATILGGGSLIDSMNAGIGQGGAASAVGAPATGGATGNAALDIPALAKKYNVPEEAIRYDLATNDGKGIAELISKGAKGEKHIVNGVVVDLSKAGEGLVNGQVFTSSDGKTIVVNKGPDGQPQVVVPAGALEAQAAQAGVAAGVKASSTPIKVFDPKSQREVIVPESTALGLPGATRGSAKAQAGDSDRLAILQDELAKTKRMLSNPGDYMTPAQRREDPDGSKFVARLQGDVAGLERELSALGGAGMPAGPSAPEKASAEAQGELNKLFVKNLEGVQQAGRAADDTLASVGVARDALKKLGGSGWGTEGRAAAANVLAGLGLAPERVKEYAASAQQFQSAAMTRLWTTLNAAKGPQTEGDADRAKKTFASLQNTTKANEFILDLAQAQAERDKLKAMFYEAAVPKAREAGDLGSVERAWAQRAPSVFTMPTMRKWGVSGGATGSF